MAARILLKRRAFSLRHFTNLSLGVMGPVLVSCNGQTAFIEQSRALQREIAIATSSDDVRAGRRQGTTSVGDHEGQQQSASQTNASDENSVTVSPSGPADTVLGPKTGLDPDAVLATTPNPSPVVGPVATQQPDAITTLKSGPVVGPNTTPKPAPPVTPRPGDVVSVELQQPRPKVDILWVVDSSQSMEWAQNQLKSKFESFATKLKETRIDFQLGVTSLDVCQVDSVTGDPMTDELCPDDHYVASGQFVGGRVVGPLRGTLQADPVTKHSILTDTSDFVQAFQRTAMLGTDGAGFEHGLWAAKLAIEKSIRSGGENAGFVRSDASLSVVVLSDEEDDSVQMWCEDAYGRTSLTSDGKKDLNLCRAGGRSPFLDAFGMSPFALMKTPKGNPFTSHKFTADQFKSWVENTNVKGSGNFRVSAITGLRGQNGAIDCNLKNNGPKESGTNYIKAAQLTGGAVENICSSDWSSVLKNIGQNTVELATRVSLPAGRIPYTGTIAVQVDGHELNDKEFSYDKLLHAVVFKAPPPLGAHVVVTYRETLVD